MSKEDVLGDVLKADDLISSGISGIKSLICLVQEMPNDSQVKRIIEDICLFQRMEDFQGLLSYDQVKEDNRQKTTVIETFIAFLRMILIRLSSLPYEDVDIQQFVLLKEMFPEKDPALNLAYNVLSSTIVLATFNLEKASKMTEENIQIEVEFKKKEKKD